MNDANHNRVEDVDDQEIASSQPNTARLEAYLREQLTAARDRPQGRRRVYSAVSVALIREVRREWLARVDRLLSQFGELESGADPDIVPRLAQSFWSVFTAQDARCERAPTRNKPEWQTCSCPVCHATRSLDDNFGVEIELEALLESACAVAYGGEMDRTDDYIVERLLEVVDQTFCGFVFGERVYAGALRALTGKQR